MVVAALLRALVMLAKEHTDVEGMDVDGEEVKTRLSEKVGEVLAGRILDAGNRQLVGVLANADVKL
jgi:hypothetical protein